MSESKNNQLARQAVSECLEAIRKATKAMPKSSRNDKLMEEMVLTTVAAILLGNGRMIEERWIVDPQTAILGSSVEILINHGQIAQDEPVIGHALRVLYLLGEEERCKDVHDGLRLVARAYSGTHDMSYWH